MRKIMYGTTCAVLASHVLFLLFEQLPFFALLVGFAAHASYFWLLQSFPFLSLMSPPYAPAEPGAHLRSSPACFLAPRLVTVPFLHSSMHTRRCLSSVALFVVSNFLWIRHFLSHYHQLTQVACFMLWMGWLVPFGFFLSLSANESTLPDRQAMRTGAGGGFFLGGSKGRDV